MQRQKKTVAKNRITLDAKHNEIIKGFKDSKKSLPSKRKELTKLKKEYVGLNKKKVEDLTEEELDRKYEIADLIKDINEEIDKIENNEEENSYYLKASKLLCNYYDDIDNTATNMDDEPVKVVKQPSNVQKGSISSFFQPGGFVRKKDEDKDKDKEEGDKEEDKKNIYSKKKKVAEPTINCNNRAFILNEYMKIVDPSYYNITDAAQIDDICENCNTEMTLIQSEGTVVCEKCGLCEYVIIDSDKPSYKDPRVEVGYFAYKRINHLKEVLYQAQGSESTEIPQEVYDAILMEIKKEKITNLAVLTSDKIKEYLKKLKLSKYYEHTAFILNKLSGIDSQIISKEVEDQLCSIFKAIQEPFAEICPKNRKNFLSYNYVLHKCVEFLGHNEYKCLFPLLKSREKLQVQDEMWKKVCAATGIVFVKSV